MDNNQIASDLAKLADLHRAGALTDEEFRRSKEKLLSEGAGFTAKVIARQKWTPLKLALLVGLVALLVGTLSGVFPFSYYLPRHGLGAALSTSIYRDLELGISGAVMYVVPTLTAVVVFVPLAWLVLRISRKAPVAGVALGVLYTLTDAVMGLPNFASTVSFLDDNLLAHMLRLKGIQLVAHMAGWSIVLGCTVHLAAKSEVSSTAVI